MGCARSSGTCGGNAGKKVQCDATYDPADNTDRGCLRVRGRTDSDASVVELTSAPLTPEGLLFQAARGSYNCSPMSRNLVRSNNRTVDSFGSRNDRRVRSVLDLLAEEYVVEYFYVSADGIYALTRLSNSAV